MVCVPCFVIPALIFIFRMVIQPLVYRIWGHRMQEPALSCPMPQKNKKNLNASEDAKCPVSGAAATATVSSSPEGSSKKDD